LIGELAKAEPSLLIEHFGRNYGPWLHQVAHGIDERPVVTSSEPKSISRETTFERDLHAKLDRSTLSEVFTHLCTRVAADLKRKAYVGKTVGIKLRYEDFRTLTRDITLASPTDDANEIRRAAGECLKRVALDKRLRLLGVRVGSLSKPHANDDDESAPQAELILT
jgi:DNA polymerase-4